jgi:hypothetical protein
MVDTSEGIEGAACNTDSSETWANRDAMIAAVNEFCAGTMIEHSMRILLNPRH